MDLAGVDTELAGQFANRAIALKRRQGYLRLKRRAVLLPRLLHDCSSFWAVYRSRTLASPPVSDPGSITVCSSKSGSSIDGDVCLGRNVISLDRTLVYCVQDGRMDAHNSGSTICIP